MQIETKNVAPTPYQHAVLTVPETYNLLLAGGRGGGKTYAACLAILRHVEQYAQGARVLIIRESYPAARELEETLSHLLHSAYGKVRHNRHEHRFLLPNGASVEVGQLAAPDDYQKYQGRSFSLVAIDEYGLIRDRKWVELLKSNLRGAEGVPLRTIATANPGGPGHAFLHKSFVAASPAWHPFDVDGETWVVCPSVYTDNPHLDHADYERKLRAATGNDEELARAWLTGDWNIARGAFFASALNEATHMVPEPWPHAVTADWRPAIGLDWGSAAPSVCLLGVVSPGVYGYAKGSVIVIDELAVHEPGDLNAGMHWPVGKLSESIHEMTRRWGVKYPKGVSDDAAGLDESLLDALRRHGLRVTRPKKERVAGWSLLRQMLHNAKDKNGKPGLYISTKCKYVWATLPFLERDPHRPEDLDTRGPDHGADALRYLVMHLAGRPRTGEAKHIGMY